MNQSQSPSQNPNDLYGSQSQQPSTPQPAEPRYVSVAMPTSVPYVTYTIVAVTALVYLLQLGSALAFGYYGSSLKPDFMQVIAGAISGSAQLDWLEVYGAQIRALILQGQLWRFLTPLLLHASIPHIGFNMYALFIFGPGLERSFGHWRYFLLYLLAGFSGNVLSFLLTTGPSVGASTAIFGLVAAEGVFLYQNRQLFGRRFRGAINNIIFIVVVNLAIGLTPGIDIWGHIGGLLGGLIFAWFAGPKWAIEGVAPALHVADKREARDVITGAAIVILVFGALALWGLRSLSGS